MFTCEEWHWYGSDDDICNSQREEEVVWDGLQLLVHLKADHDHEVASDGDEAEETSGYADQGGLKRRVRDDDGAVRPGIRVECLPFHGTGQKLGILILD